MCTYKECKEKTIGDRLYCDFHNQVVIDAISDPIKKASFKGVKFVKKPDLTKIKIASQRTLKDYLGEDYDYEGDDFNYLKTYGPSI